MARILTGVQSTGTPHLGNILGAIIPAIEMSNNPKNDSYLFIADMHSLTQIKEANTLRENTYATAATWLAFGLDIETGGHVFQLLFTNSQSSNEPGFMSSAEGDMVFGFNVVRVF